MYISVMYSAKENVTKYAIIRYKKMFEARAESVNAAAIAVVQEQVCYDTTKLLSDCLVMPPVCFS